MAGLVPAIHVFLRVTFKAVGCAGTRPGMTVKRCDDNVLSERFNLSSSATAMSPKNSLSQARARSTGRSEPQAPDNSVEFEKFPVLCNCKLFATRYV